MFFLDHLCHAVNEIELADCFKVSVHHMDHNLVLGLALGLAMIVELLPQLAGYAKPRSRVAPVFWRSANGQSTQARQLVKLWV